MGRHKAADVEIRDLNDDEHPVEFKLRKKVSSEELTISGGLPFLRTRWNIRPHLKEI